MLGRSSQAAVPSSISPSRSRCGVTITGGVSSEPTSSSHARSSASESLPSASSNALDQIGGLAQAVVAVRFAGQPRQITVDRVDEGRDILRQRPCHRATKRTVCFRCSRGQSDADRTVGLRRPYPIDPLVKGGGSVRRMTAERFESVQQVRDGLRDVHYLADDGIAGVVFLADRLGKPVLVEGPAGTGKTQLAKSAAEMTGARLIRLQCYEGLDESKALYEWNYKKQLLRIQADKDSDSWSEVHDDIFSDEFLLTRPLLEAISAEDPVVLLIDEVDRVEVETEALLLEILSDYQVSIPELGTIVAKQIPLVFLTSNNTRELSEALKRRCLYLHVDYPTLEREKEIVLTKVPGVTENLADQIARIVRSIRQLDLKKSPSVSETLDWARTLMLLNIETIDEKVAKETLHILLKYQTDITKTAKELSVET